MRIIFAGTPEFAAAALSALIEAGHEIALVLTQPDRPAGRGMRPSPSAVKLLAQSKAFPVLQPESLASEQIQTKLSANSPDVMVVAAYGLILPQNVLQIPRFGCINIHASLLPRWRGASPIQRALLAGDKQTGITIMQMDRGLDTGAILLQEALIISEEDTAQTLHDRLAALGAKCIVRALQMLGQGKLPARPQEASGACYAQKISKREARLDWRRSADEIARAVRAFNPAPGASTSLNGVQLKVWQARALANASGLPGEVLKVAREGILVACGSGGVRLEVLQKPGGKKLPAAEFLSGFAVKPGDIFQS